MPSIRKIKNIPKHPIEIFLEKLFNELKIGFRKMIYHVFFYQPTNDVDAFLHIIIIVAYVILIGLKVFGAI